MTLGFFNDLVARKEKDLSAEMLIVEADGKIISNSSRISGPIVLKNISELAGTSTFASQVKAGLQNRDQAQRVEFDNNGEASTFFMRPIEGTPWFLATALPTKMLTAQRDDVLSSLSLLQIPMVILLVLLQVYAIRQLVQRMKALKANIDLLSSGDADLTRRITIRAEDELGAIGHSVNTLYRLPAKHDRRSHPGHRRHGVEPRQPATDLGAHQPDSGAPCLGNRSDRHRHHRNELDRRKRRAKRR